MIRSNFYLFFFFISFKVNNSINGIEERRVDSLNRNNQKVCTRIRKKIRRNFVPGYTAYCVSSFAQSRRHSRRMMVMGKRVLEHGRWSGSRGSNYD